MRSRRPAAHRAAAFTLLEVLAAVALIALIFTALAGVSIQGLGAEGRARRTLEASLRADQILAEIEQAAVLFQAAPEAREGEEDGFFVRIVGPLPHPIDPNADPSFAGYTIEVWDADETQILAQRSTYTFDIRALEEELEAAGLLGNGATLGGALGSGGTGSRPGAGGGAAGGGGIDQSEIEAIVRDLNPSL